MFPLLELFPTVVVFGLDVFDASLTGRDRIWRAGPAGESLVSWGSLWYL